MDTKLASALATLVPVCTADGLSLGGDSDMFDIHVVTMNVGTSTKKLIGPTKKTAQPGIMPDGFAQWGRMMCRSLYGTTNCFKLH